MSGRCSSRNRLLNNPAHLFPLHVADSNIHVKGLFAGATIPNGAYVGFYQGNETLENGVYVLWVQQAEEGEDSDRWMGYDGTNELRFLNHTTAPNCEMDGQELYAARDIEINEELTIDYGEWFDPTG